MKLYAISDEILTPYSQLPCMLIEAIKAGIHIFQLRDKHLSDDDLQPICLELSRICDKYNIPFILNDRIELALRLNTFGLHLGRDDENMPFDKIRAKFNGMLGISCYGDIQRALIYQNLGADYVAFGSVFQSPTKPQSQIIGTDILQQARYKLHIPICAIGGVNSHNISMINADMVALISAIWKGDITNNITTLQSRIKEKYI